MAVEVSPVGVKCNLNCPYCYEIPMRDAANLSAPYDLEKIKKTLDNHNQEFIVFGGEPLLLPIKDLEELWQYGFERYGSNGIQTNGSLFTEEHFELIEKYNVHVGISLDGPEELNDTRWAGNLRLTRDRTEKTHWAIQRLVERGRPPSLIITLHKLNATEELLPRLKYWLKEMDNIGINSARLHTLEVEFDSVQDSLALTPERNAELLLEMAEFESFELTNLKFDLFSDIKKFMRIEDEGTTCIWNACDPYTTRAVQGVDGQGEQTNCGRSNKEGINFKKSDKEGFERYIALYHSPQEHKGCKDCRFFLMCKGQCPGTAEDTDWRNRTDLCETWKKLFGHFEKEFIDNGILPLSKSPHRKKIEEEMIRRWSIGQNPHISHVYKQILEDKEWVNQETKKVIQHGDYTRT